MSLECLQKCYLLCVCHPLHFTHESQNLPVISHPESEDIEQTNGRNALCILYNVKDFSSSFRSLNCNLGLKAIVTPSHDNQLIRCIRSGVTLHSEPKEYFFFRKINITASESHRGTESVLRSDKELNNLLFFSHVKETASKQWAVIRVVGNG